MKWNRDLADYPAGTWALTYYIRGPKVYSVTATANGTTHEVVIAATTTDDFQAGTYRLTGRVSSGGEVFAVYEGELEVKPDASASNFPQDLRSHARKCLDLIEEVLENRMGSDRSRYVIAGQQIDKIPHAELRDMRNYYAGEVRRERNAEELAQGRAPSKNILVRFGRPS